MSDQGLVKLAFELSIISLSVLVAWSACNLQSETKAPEALPPIKVLDCSEDSAIREELRMCQEEAYALEVELEMCSEVVTNIENEIDEAAAEKCGWSDTKEEAPYVEPPC